MSKYIEIPQKPAVVRAIQYVGMDGGVPLFNDPVPGWVFGAMAKGHLQVIDGGLHCRGRSMDLGSWIIVDDQDVGGDAMRTVLAADFLALYRPARKKPAARKPRAAKAGVNGVTAAVHGVAV